MHQTAIQPKAHILLIHSESALRNNLSRSLGLYGFQVYSSNSLKNGLEQLPRLPIQMLILVQNQGQSLEHNLHHLRSVCTLPLLLFSADTSDALRLRALRCGADDCVSLAVEPDELALRIDAMLRRFTATVNVKKIRQDNLQFNDFHLQKKQRRVTLFNKPLTLTPLQFKLLWCLLAHRGQVVNRRQLYKEGLEKQLSAYDRSLDMHIVRLRKKLQNAGLPACCINTIHGEGYRFLEESHLDADEL